MSCPPRLRLSVGAVSVPAREQRRSGPRFLIHGTTSDAANDAAGECSLVQLRGHSVGERLASRQLPRLQLVDELLQLFQLDRSLRVVVLLPLPSQIPVLEIDGIQSFSPLLVTLPNERRAERDEDRRHRRCIRALRIWSWTLHDAVDEFVRVGAVFQVLDTTLDPPTFTLDELQEFQIRLSKTLLHSLLTGDLHVRTSRPHSDSARHDPESAGRDHRREGDDIHSGAVCQLGNR